MDLAPPQQINLVQMMADKAGLWSVLAQQHGLQSIPYDKLVSWAYGDFVFTPELPRNLELPSSRRDAY